MFSGKWPILYYIILCYFSITSDSQLSVFRLSFFGLIFFLAHLDFFAYLFGWAFINIAKYSRRSLVLWGYFMTDFIWVLFRPGRYFSQCFHFVLPLRPLARNHAKFSVGTTNISCTPATEVPVALSHNEAPSF